MEAAKPPTSKLRWFVAAAILLVILSVAAVTFLRVPRWADYLANAFLGLVFGLYVLLYPLPRMSPLIRRVLLVIFFSLSALELVQLLLKGV